MKIDFTHQEAKDFIGFMKSENDIVRLVDPLTQQVHDYDNKTNSSDICSKLWGRCERCENCTSIRALQSQGRVYKMEILNQHTYWVLSRYIKIEGSSYVMEVVNDVSDNLLINSNQRDEIGKIINNYNHLLITDSLTGVYNRRFLDEVFLPSLKCCHDSTLTINVAIMDFDDFKLVNDTYGHQAGDALLKDSAGFWKQHFNSRKKGAERLVIRFGGDEMLIVTCGMNLKTFNNEIERYYKQMRKLCYYTEEIQIPFSITFGTSSSEEFGDGWTWDELLFNADQRMYEGKKLKKT